MTDAAPKRIWVSAPNEDNEVETWTDPDEGGTEYILASEHAALLQSERDAWRKEPESSEAWCFGNQYALDRLCHVLGVDPDKVDWDGSDGSLDEEADSLINRILRANDDADGNSPDVAALIAEARREDAKLLLDAYKGILVLRRILDKAGLVAGASAADQISKRIVDAHPEFPGMASLRALKETTHD